MKTELMPIKKFHTSSKGVAAAAVSLFVKLNKYINK